MSLIQTKSLELDTGMQTNLSRHPNRHSIPCKPYANGSKPMLNHIRISKPLYDICVSTLKHDWCVSNSFRFRVCWLEFKQIPEQQNRLQLLPRQLQRRRQQPELRRWQPELLRRQTELRRWQPQRRHIPA